MRAVVMLCPLLEYLLHQVWYIEDSIGNWYARRLQCLDLPFCRSCIARDDRACVSHTLSRRCGAAGDEGHNSLAHCCNNFCGIPFVATAYLSTHHDGACFRICLEEFDVVG